jgi:hypothetical protein
MNIEPLWMAIGILWLGGLILLVMVNKWAWDQPTNVVSSTNRGLLVAGTIALLLAGTLAAYDKTKH